MASEVIPAKAGIQENTGFRVKPGMTNYTGLMSLYVWSISLCLIRLCFPPGDDFLGGTYYPFREEVDDQYEKEPEVE